MQVLSVLRPGDEVFYTSGGENRRVMVTHVDREQKEFDALVGATRVWGAIRQITAIHAKDGRRYSCHDGVAILD